MKPVKENLIIKLEEVETVTAGGLVIPDSAAKTPQNATVIAVGEEVKTVNPGDELIIRQRAGQKFEANGEEFTLIHVGEIMAVL
jgi:chaperonin GroES